MTQELGLTRRDFLKSFGLMSVLISSPEAFAQLWLKPNRLRLAVIGINDASKYFLRLLAVVPEVEIVGIADEDVSALEEVSTLPVGRSFPADVDAGTLLKSTQPDAIILGSKLYAEQTAHLWKGRSLILDLLSDRWLHGNPSSVHFHSLPAAWPMETWMALREIVLTPHSESVRINIDWRGPTINADELQSLLIFCLAVCEVAVPAVQELGAASCLVRNFAHTGSKVAIIDLSFRFPASSAFIDLSYKPSMISAPNSLAAGLPKGEGIIEFETSQKRWEVPVSFKYSPEPAMIAAKSFIENDVAPDIYSCKHLKAISQLAGRALKAQVPS